jgi:hypothetical protein
MNNLPIRERLNEINPDYNPNEPDSKRILKTLEAKQSRFELCSQAFKVIRNLRNPGRIEDTSKGQPNARVKPQDV